ncbi:hypothetical protein [Actinoallomurus acaciae]|uniref:Uncharacterized protein n=1 Tax=Actinoallomurus acaciae TaxID=502577 RepID=A0ABV5Y8T1_9ACTN
MASPNIGDSENEEPRTKPPEALPPADNVRGPHTADDRVIAMALTATWMLTTGRRLRDVPMFHDLSVPDLIDFWADDHIASNPKIRSGLPEREHRDNAPSYIRRRMA